MKKDNFLIVYDYYLLKDGKEHYGIVGLFLYFLKSNKFNFKVNKQPFREDFFNIIVKIKALAKDINNNSFNKVFCYNLINTINAWIIKKIFFKEYKIFFISADFSKNRFNNFIMNQIYIFLDYFASIIADEVWSCSRRVFDYRKKFLKDKKNFYIPNIPNYKKLNLEKNKNFTIVMISFLNFNYMFDEVYSIFEYIKSKNIKLILIGEGDMRDEIIQKINEHNVRDYVELTGYLDHSKIREILEKSHLGLALYGGKLDYNFWGDSIKIREYTYYNLPVITTKNVYNFKEVSEENIGLCLEDFGGLKNSIAKIFEDKVLYKEIVESTKKYNSKYQIDKIYMDRIG